MDIQVALNMNGGSGAETAAAARSGVAQGARDLVSYLDAQARGLTMSNPLAETAAG